MFAARRVDRRKLTSDELDPRRLKPEHNVAPGRPEPDREALELQHNLIRYLISPLRILVMGGALLSILLHNITLHYVPYI